jgi:hypothetical protein
VDESFAEYPVDDLFEQKRILEKFFSHFSTREAKSREKPFQEFLAFYGFLLCLFMVAVIFKFSFPARQSFRLSLRNEEKVVSLSARADFLG